jgi:hypothetical protein
MISNTIGTDVFCTVVVIEPVIWLVLINTFMFCPAVRVLGEEISTIPFALLASETTTAPVPSTKLTNVISLVALLNEVTS